MVEAIYKDIIDNMTWSYSRLRAYDDCRYKWFMKYILEEDESPMFYSSYGKFVHEIIARYNLGLIKEEVMPEEFLVGFLKEVQGRRPPEKTVAKYLEKGLEYFKEFSPMPFKILATEQKIDFIIDGYNFTGFIDCLGEKDGELIVLDHKSRDLKPRSKRKKPTEADKELDEMLIQLYLYAEAVNQVYGKYPKTLMFNCFKARTLIEEEFQQNKCEEAKTWAVQKIKEIRDSQDFYPSIEYFKCMNICGFNNECCYWEESDVR